jgi:hypothetical protein
MAEIYRWASRVLVWLGEKDENTDIAFDAVERIDRIMGLSSI